MSDKIELNLSETIYLDDLLYLKLSRYVIFAYNTYYPSGGFRDAVHTCNDLDEVKTTLKSIREADPWADGWYKYWHVLDMDERRIFFQGEDKRRD